MLFQKVGIRVDLLRNNYCTYFSLRYILNYKVDWRSAMTFEEWLAEQENCQPTDWNDAKSVYRFWIEVARRAWEAGYDEGVADSDPAVF